MIFKLKNFSMAAFVAAALLSGPGCASGPRLYLQYGDKLQQTSLDKILAENSLGAGENIKVVHLGRTQSASQHLVQIRDREAPHVHQLHDATVTVLSGHGYLILGQKRIDLRAGDVIHIPRGVPHYYVNAAGEPSVALAVYAPAFDGKDTHPVKLP
jgi:quercetin dioxygenase-like cupin family protein